jgi:hypothetical protein
MNNQKEKLTVLIPYRDRKDNIDIFIPYFHNFMKNYFSNIIYDIVIIEQGNDKLFNKGLLYNAGFILTSGQTDYYAFHDVDQLPISANYSYPKLPIHLCVNVFNQNNNGLLKNNYSPDFNHKGGSVLISKEDFIIANGYSNNYWGWGAEDNDFVCRLNFVNNTLYRYGKNNENGYYLALNHKLSNYDNYNKNEEYQKKIINKEIDWRKDGLHLTKFEVIKKLNKKRYTKYIIDFNNKPEDVDDYILKN